MCTGVVTSLFVICEDGYILIECECFFLILMVLCLQKKTVKFTFPRGTIFVFCLLLTLSIGFFVSADTQVYHEKSLFLDVDQDGLSDEEEKVLGTDPLKKDTDDDSYSDGIEVESGYDPLKPAPGDKLTTVADDGLGKGGYDDSSESELTNLTKEASNQVVGILSNISSENPSVDMEDMNASVEDLLRQSSVDIKFPEIDIKTIKIKEIKCKDAESEECQKKQKDATIEYLTVLAYLLANNSPVTLKGSGDLDLAASSLLNDVMLSFSVGNFSSLQKNKDKVNVFLKNVKDISVPENMLSVHVKALQLAMFSQELGDVFGNTTEDPMSQISLLAQTQGIISAALGLSLEIGSEFKKLGIDNIPVDL